MVQDIETDGRQGFSERLRSALRESGYPERGAAVRLAGELHISPRAVGKWLNAEAMPDTKRLEQLARLARVSVEWLLTGSAADPIRGNNFAAAHASSHRRLPVVSWVSAGTWGEAADPYLPGDAGEWKEIIGRVSSCAFVLRVQGDSMTNPNGFPSAPEGSLIVVDPEVPAENGKLVVAKLIDSELATFKKLVIDGNQRYLKPLNPDYKPIEVNGNCRIIGVVVQIVLEL